MKFSKFVNDKMQKKQVFQQFGMVGFLKTLPEEDRLILTAVAICGFSFRKTAGIVNLNRRTVSRIYKQRRQELHDFMKYSVPL